MKDLYYTPSIEEFCVGFEFEHRSDNNEWSPFTIKTLNNMATLSKGLNGKLNAPPWYENLYLNDYEVRVKYLDREDLESLGFKDQVEFYVNEAFTIYVKANTNKGLWLEIYRKDTVDEGLAFEGRVKNKSQLRKLLILIGYEETKN